MAESLHWTAEIEATQARSLDEHDGWMLSVRCGWAPGVRSVPLVGVEANNVTASAIACSLAA